MAGFGSQLYDVVSPGEAMVNEEALKFKRTNPYKSLTVEVDCWFGLMILSGVCLDRKTCSIYQTSI